jgi:uncharacterized membrane protein
MTSHSRTLVRLGSAIWCAAIVIAPLLNAGWIYAFFSAICHQDPARSGSLAGNSLPVCIRCTSIYFGFFLAALACRQPNYRLLQIATAATVMEVALAITYWDSAWLRSLTGLAFGAAVAPFVILGVAQLLERMGGAEAEHGSV